MDNLSIKLLSLDKIKLFRACKEVIFEQLEKDVITVEKAEEIMNVLKKNIVKANNKKLSEELYIYLINKYPELDGVKIIFNQQNQEKFHNLLIYFLDEIINQGNIDLADEIMQQIETENPELMIQKIKTKYPIEFTKTLKQLDLF